VQRASQETGFAVNLLALFVELPPPRLEVVPSGRGLRTAGDKSGDVEGCMELSARVSRRPWNRGAVILVA
jgi:hypothetical protein